MNQKRTRVPLPHPAPPVKQTDWLMIALGLVLILCIGLIAYETVDGLIQGRIGNMARGKRFAVYSLTAQPTSFWFAVAAHCLLALFLSGAAWVLIWLGRTATVAPSRRDR
ncbi:MULTISPECIES: hypothetical protein [Pseudomonas]|uniref:hypothetical protein n=1 Tax=Pseudomonas TaxID=286 RepID=UPI0002702590|nr:MULTISPECIES: hypothetical protein [Pseudomonas]EJM29522.1 hypothetical protein PMI24_01599 [Pseudomonas sp. GM25]MCU0090475.1 hypothetical protein [Pseudomonas koreensis]